MNQMVDLQIRTFPDLQYCQKISLLFCLFAVNISTMIRIYDAGNLGRGEQPCHE
jgi:hypothetical protein